MNQHFNYANVPAPAAQATEVEMHDYLLAVREALLHDKQMLDVTSGMRTTPLALTALEHKHV